MIDFACKEFRIDEIIKCGLGLTRAELAILYFIIEQEDWFDSKEIAEKLGKDSSTIQRALKKFYQNNLVKRRQINLEKGGYAFAYISEDKRQIKNILEDIIENWTDKVKLELRKWSSK
ncbi:MAG: MarR family transcriptional regulator [Nanobdellota archaeon]